MLRIVAPFVTFRFDVKEFRSISRSVFVRISEDYRCTSYDHTNGTFTRSYHNQQAKRTPLSKPLPNINSINPPSTKAQIEIYQYLLGRMGFFVSPICGDKRELVTPLHHHTQNRPLCNHTIPI